MQAQPRRLNGLPRPNWLAREWVFVLVMIGLAVTRLAYLDADPNQFKRVGDIGDEGWFWNAARNQVLFGQYLIPEDDNGFGLWVNPLTTAIDTALFGALGPSYFAGRLPAALSGLLILGSVYFVVKKDYGRRAGLAALLLLGLNVHFYNYNRLGLAETSRLFLILAALWLWLADTKRPYGTAALSGLVMTGAMLTKVRPDFVFYPLALWLLLWLRGELNWKRIIAFAIPIGLLALGLGWFIIARFDVLESSILFLLQNTSVTHWTVPAYIPFLPFAVLTNAVLRLLPVWGLYLAAWPVLTADLGRFSAAPRQFLQSLRQADLICLAILVGTFVCGVVYDFGDRRMFPFVVALAFFAARLFAPGDNRNLAAPPVAANRWLAAGLLAAVGVLWLSWWKSATTLPWPDGSANWWLSWAGAAGLVGAGLAGLYWVYRTAARSDARVLVSALALTHLFTLTDLSLSQMASQIPSASLPRWAATALAGAMGAVFLTVYSLRSGARLQAFGRWALAGAVAAFGVIVIGGQLIRPTFTNRDASRALAQIVRPGEIILGEPIYEACVETEARCVLWTADVSEDESRFNRDQSSFVRRKYWWARQDEIAEYYHPAVSPCAYDSAGRVVGVLTPAGSFQVRRGPQNWTMELYRIDDPAERGCPPRQEE